ncbi:MAG TPA: hypothetical protein VHC97_13330 [Thermoanaerobaculia bacterium]|nr:hypothetical protein [Thermoanaerobaculia bacterium]
MSDLDGLRPGRSAIAAAESEELAERLVFSGLAPLLQVDSAKQMQPATGSDEPGGCLFQERAGEPGHGTASASGPGHVKLQAPLGRTLGGDFQEVGDQEIATGAQDIKSKGASSPGGDQWGHLAKGLAAISSEMPQLGAEQDVHHAGRKSDTGRLSKGIDIDWEAPGLPAPLPPYVQDGVLGSRAVRLPDDGSPDDMEISLGRNREIGGIDVVLGSEIDSRDLGNEGLQRLRFTRRPLRTRGKPDDHTDDCYDRRTTQR